jgi:membrane fusion protein (multidrug efflux system)
VLAGLKPGATNALQDRLELSADDYVRRVLAWRSPSGLPGPRGDRNGAIGLVPVPGEFNRSLHSLNRDGFGRSVAGLAVAALLLGLWLVWFLTAPVARYEVSDRARIEVDQSIHAIQAPVAGRVVLTNLMLGREVEAGDTLFELETDSQHLQVKEEESRVAAIASELEALHAELAAEEQAVRTETEAHTAALDQSRAQYREAEAQRAFAEQEAERLARLRAEGVVSERDLGRAAADAGSRRAASEASALATERLAAEHRRLASERRAAIARLEGEMSRLEGARTTTARIIERLRFEVARRRVVAPVAGRLGEVAVLRAGGWVDEGDTLGAVVPRGNLRIVAEFLPTAALGRIRPEQRAWMRLAGFPWAQYGAIPATVQRAANEVRDGRVRVELLVDRAGPVRAPLQHGLPGFVEVEVETVTPARLVLRTAGQMLARPGQHYP